MVKKANEEPGEEIEGTEELEELGVGGIEEFGELEEFEALSEEETFGEAMFSGNLTDEVCVQVMVAEKRGASQVESEAFVPQEVEGI